MTGTQLDKQPVHCGQGVHCQSIYRRIGQAKGPSVTGSVLVAFGIPIGVFILTLAIAARVLGQSAAKLNGLMVLALLIAIAATAVVVLVIWKTTQRPVDPGRERDTKSLH